MGHNATHAPPEVNRATAEAVAAVMHALATPSRVLILGQLRYASASVGEIASAVQMDPSAVSHQLSILRRLCLVTASRDGRRMIYMLHDDHVAELIDQAIHHTTHRKLGLSRPHA